MRATCSSLLFVILLVCFYTLATATSTEIMSDAALREVETGDSYAMEFLSRRLDSKNDETNFSYRVTLGRNMKIKVGKILIGNLCSKELILKSCTPSGAVIIKFDSSSKSYGLYLNIRSHDLGSTKEYTFKLKGNVGMENSVPCHWFKDSDKDEIFDRRFIKGPGCCCKVDDDKSQHCNDDGSMGCKPGFIKVGFICVPSCFPKCKENEYCGSGNKCICKDGCKKDKDGSCKPECGSDCKASEHEVCAAPGKCVCEDGYRRQGEKCIPVCDKTKCDDSCEQCQAPNKCVCKSGFEYSSQHKKCRPVCKKTPCKENEECTGPEKCTCKPGYKKEGNICKPQCDCCPDDQVCIAPNKCGCKPGFTMYNKRCIPECKPGCPANSFCNGPNDCQCKPGYEKKNGVCVPKCDENEEIDCGKCVCKDGYQRGSDGECKPVCHFCPNNSYCEKPGVCKCKTGYKLENGKCVKICNPACTDPNAFCNEDGECECKCDFERAADGTCQPKNRCNCNPTTETCVNNKCVCKTGYEREGNYGICKPVCTCSGPNEQLPSTCTVPSTQCSCKAGWKRDPTTNKCTVPICNCGPNQRCVAPNVCVCVTGYQWIENECKPECNPKCCDNQICSAPNTCTCKPGFEEVDGECVPKCNCGANEVCVAPNQCQCKNGYEKGSDGKCKPKCDQCDGTGQICIAPGQCVCAEGYFWNEETRQCKPKCNCGPNQQCVAPNTCVCEQGYKWNEQLKKCEPDCGTCPAHSYCATPGHCKCEEGYEQNAQGLCVPKCDCVRGSCNNGQCVCPPDYWGPKCEFKYCTCFDFYSNDTRTCANNGKCVDVDTCVCNPGWTGSRCHIPICYGIPASSPEKVCSGHGICAGIDYCQCEVGWTGKYCDQPTEDACPPGYAGIICSIPVCNGTRADDPRVCSGRGICSSPNTCICPYPYSGADCSCSSTLPVCLPEIEVPEEDQQLLISNECSACNADSACCSDMRQGFANVCYNPKTHSCPKNSVNQKSTLCPLNHEVCGTDCYNPILYACDEATQTLRYVTDMAERATRAQLYPMNSATAMSISITLLLLLCILIL